MKKYVLLLALSLTTVGFSQQTIPANSRLRITKNTEDNSAQKIIVKSTDDELNWIWKDNLKTNFESLVGSELDYASNDGEYSFDFFTGDNFEKEFAIRIGNDNDRRSIFFAEYSSIGLMNFYEVDEFGRQMSGKITVSDGMPSLSLNYSDEYSFDYTTLLTFNQPNNELTNIKIPAPATQGNYTIPIKINGQIADSEGNVTIDTGGSGTAPTLQEVLTAGATATVVNTVSLNAYGVNMQTSGQGALTIIPGQAVTLQAQGNSNGINIKSGGGSLTLDGNLVNLGGVGLNNLVRLNGRIEIHKTTVANLPTINAGDTAYATVTDATSPIYLQPVAGGGSVVCPVFFNGITWVAH